ncbi:MAG: hypothetical protein QXP02_03810 [Desulfurococcaceae archaeon]
MQDLLSLITLITIYALIDSIDPCFLAIYTGILVAVGIRDLAKLWLISSYFIASVYLGYFIFGFLVRYLVTSININRYYLFILVIIYGVALCGHSLYRIFYRRRSMVNSICREDNIGCRIANSRFFKLLKSMKISIPYVVILGLLSSITILPCSAGLYNVYIILTMNMSVLEWIPYTLLYVAIFISPLVLIAISITGLLRIKRVYQFLINENEYVKLIGGILAILTGIYIYNYYII